MSNRPKNMWTILIVMAGICVISACEKSEEPRLFVSPSRIDAGDIILDGAAKSETIVITNRSNSSLSLTARWDCGCVRVNPTEISVPAGASRQADVVINPAPTADHVATTVYLTPDDPRIPTQQIEVRARVAPWLATDRQVVQAHVPQNDQPTDFALVMQNLRQKSFEGTAVVNGPASDYVLAVNNRISVSAHSTADFQFAVRYPGNKRIRGSLDFVGLNSATPLVSVPIVITGVPTLQANPPTALFQASRTSLLIRVMRTDGKLFSLGDVHVEPSSLQMAVEMDRSSKSAFHELTLRLKEDNAKSSLEGVLAVKTTTDGKANDELELPVLIARQG